MGLDPRYTTPAFTASIHGWATWGGLGAVTGLCKVLVCILGLECMQMVEMVTATG